MQSKSWTERFGFAFDFFTSDCGHPLTIKYTFGCHATKGLPDHETNPLRGKKKKKKRLTTTEQLLQSLGVARGRSEELILYFRKMTTQMKNTKFPLNNWKFSNGALYAQLVALMFKQRACSSGPRIVSKGDSRQNRASVRHCAGALRRLRSAAVRQDMSIWEWYN